MNMYKDYVKEREGLDCIEKDHGFLLWRITDKPERNLYIADYYVKPSQRRNGIAYEMAREAIIIARENNCKVLYCQCDERSNNWELSKFTIENFGFTQYAKEGTVIKFFMEI